MKELKKDSFILIRPFMVTKLNLKGNSLLIYALIHGITVNEGAFYGSIEYLQTWCNASNRNLIDCLKELVSRGLITKKKTGNAVLYKANIITESEESSQQSEESSLVGVKKVHSESEESSHNILDINSNKEFINSSPTKSEAEPFPEYKPNVVKKTQRPKKPTKTEQTEHYLSSLSAEEFINSRECAQKFVNYLIQLQNSTTAAKNLKPWQRDFAMFASAENKSFDEIIKVIDFVFNDDWWSSRVSSAQMIINNYGMLYQRMNGFRSSDYQNKRKYDLERGNMNTGNRDYTL